MNRLFSDLQMALRQAACWLIAPGGQIALFRAPIPQGLVPPDGTRLLTLPEFISASMTVFPWGNSINDEAAIVRFKDTQMGAGLLYFDGRWFVTAEGVRVGGCRDVNLEQIASRRRFNLYNHGGKVNTENLESVEGRAICRKATAAERLVYYLAME